MITHITVRATKAFHWLCNCACGFWQELQVGYSFRLKDTEMDIILFNLNVNGNKAVAMTFTCFNTKLFMMIIGDSPAYESPITATCGPALSWTVGTNVPCRPASSLSVRSTALRYSELASRVVTKGRQISEPDIYRYTEYSVLKHIQTWEAWISLQFRFRWSPCHPGIHWCPVSVGSTEIAHVALAGKSAEKIQKYI